MNAAHVSWRSRMDAVLGIRSCCTPSMVACGPVLNWKRSGTGYRHRLVCLPPSATLEDKTDDINGLQEPAPRGDKRTATSTEDVIELFNVTQQNMLYLNKQRLTAMEELKKTRRENELLLARIAKLDAEYQVSSGECKILQKKLEAAAGSSTVSGFRAGVSKSQNQRHLDPFSVWSKLLLRIDSMAMTGSMTLGQASALRNLVRKRDAEAADVYINFFEKDDRELSSYLLKLLAPNRRRGVHVVHICTEMAPIAQAGSLGTYIINLSQALRRKGHLVEVILPKYASSDLSHVEDLEEINTDLFSYFSGEWHKNKIWTGVLNGIAVTLIDSKHPGGFFDRENLYDNEDDFERFTYFCRASLEYILKSGKQPNVLHIHNWQTAAVAPLFWEIYANQGLQNTRILFTCHDFKYQCLQEPSKLSLCGLNLQKLNRPDRLQDNLETGLVNILKGGIIYSNGVTTVSPLYAHDVLSKDHGHGLDSTLNQHKQKFYGISNGVDESTWDPRVDPLIPAIYSIEDLSGKSACKSVLWRSLQLPDLEKPKPLVGCIVPNVTEKDLEFLRTAFETAVSKGAQFVFVGASKIPHIRNLLQDLQKNESGYFATSYDESLAHQLLAASDILLCPCGVEPLDEWPLIAMAYGTVRVAREVYGVPGRISDADESLGDDSAAKGFIFHSRQASDMANALSRALDRLEGDPEEWTRLVHNGMKSNNSWDGKCVESYEAAYFSICNI